MKSLLQLNIKVLRLIGIAFKGISGGGRPGGVVLVD